MDAQTTTLPSAATTLDSFSLQLQDLPVASLVPAGILLLLGLLLLICGKHLLRPVLVIAIVLAGALLGVPLLGSIMPETHGLLLTLLGGIAGAVVAAVAWRLFLGAALGVTLAFFCATREAEPTRPPPPSRSRTSPTATGSSSARRRRCGRSSRGPTRSGTPNRSRSRCF